MGNVLPNPDNQATNQPANCIFGIQSSCTRPMPCKTLLHGEEGLQAWLRPQKTVHHCEAEEEIIEETQLAEYTNPNQKQTSKQS